MHDAQRLISPLLAASLTLLMPRLADACGGTFCDGSTLTPMPVDQVGEDILFVRDGNEIEVHVRIQYTGQAESFAWLVPLPALPEVRIGSDPLFAALSAATIPSWTTSVTFEDPDDIPPNGCAPGGCLDLEGAPPPPDVVFNDIIGSFEVVVLETDSADAVLEFFDQNAYAYEPAAAPLIQTYLDEGSLIAAVKLTADVNVDEIHPLVFRFVGDEPCIPLRLTKVAAREEMAVRAYFLGQQRWAPSNYKHVVLNPLIYSWNVPTQGSYFELLSLAVDEAGGHAFATEYAGDSGVVATGDIWQPNWASTDLSGMDAHMAIEALRSMGLIAGDQIHPQVLAALRLFLPVPQGWGAPEKSFWTDHAEHPQLFDLIDFDAVGFAEMLDDRLFDPAMQAVDLLEAWPYLTRLHTSISPAEMTLDPTFHETADLPALSEDRNASAITLSGGDWIRYEVPFSGGPDPARAPVCVANQDSWPALNALPRALRIEQIPEMGPPQVTVDNEAEIQAWAMDSYQASPCPDTGSGSGSGSGSESGSDSGGTTLGGPDIEPDRSVGCGCASAAPRGGPLGLVFSLAALIMLRRRRTDARA